MSPEDRNQEVNIPIEEDRLVDLLVYTIRPEHTHYVYRSEKRRNEQENVSLHFQEIRDNHR